MALGPPEDAMVNLLILVLSAFLGLVLVQGVSRLLHTPLMSLTNMISSVSIVAALIVLSKVGTDWSLPAIAACAALALATANAVGGYVITDRILQMFVRDEKPKGGRP
jgi:NAD(P) transhydrogenase subunit alpha